MPFSYFVCTRGDYYVYFPPIVVFCHKINLIKHSRFDFVYLPSWRIEAKVKMKAPVTLYLCLFSHI